MIDLLIVLSPLLVCLALFALWAICREGGKEE